MSPLTLGLVLLAAFLHASWNALLRGGADRTHSMALMSTTLGAVGCIALLATGMPSAASFVYVIVSGILHWLYTALLVMTYRSGDLGETYPVARGSSPALVALGGALFAGERISVPAAAGVALVSAGIVMLALAKGRLREMNLPWALMTGAVIAAYTLVDGVGVRLSDNWAGYTAAVFAFFIAVPAWFLATRGLAFFRASRVETGKALGGGLISIAAYAIVIWAMQAAPMGAVSALRETSVVFAALLGFLFLGERVTVLRVVACCVIALGAACVGWRV